jgi:CRP-like cAMP-binding protein
MLARSSGPPSSVLSSSGVRIDPVARERLNLLAGVKLFESLSQQELKHVLEVTKEASFPAGKNVVVEGEAGGRFYLILEGQARVKVGGRTRRVLGVGDHFGEISLIDKGPRMATVTAETPLRALTLASFNFTPLLEKPAITKKLLVEMCSRFRALDRSFTP